MKSKWETKKLSDVCTIVNGGTPDTAIKEYWGGTFLWITPKDMGKLKQFFVGDTERKITKEGLKNSSAKLLPINSVILSSRAPIGHLAINSKEIATNQGCKGLIPHKNLNTFYLFYFLKKSVELLNALGSGTTFKELSGTKLATVEIPLPPLEEQHRIVSKLDDIFKDAENAKEMAKKNVLNATSFFEQFLQGIFGKDNGWEKKTLGEVSKYFIGLTYSPKDVGDKGIIVLRSSNVQDGILDFSDIVRVNKKVKENLIVMDGDILMCSRNGSKRLVGKTATIKNLDEKMTFGTFMTVIRSPYNPFLSWFFKSNSFRNQINGGSNPMINQITKYMLDDITLALPPQDIQDITVSKIDSLYAETKELERIYTKKILDLEELKKSVLNKAFSGEL